MFGLRRRVWRIRRSVPRIARPLSRFVHVDPPESPVFVLGCPRSGTTVLLQGLRRSQELGSVQAEGHILWDEFHHPQDRGWDSDALGETDVTNREREYVYCAIRMFARNRRFVDKTPENCLRVPYLAHLFPGAVFIFLRRRAPDNVSSLMEAWRARPRFVKYRLPEPLTGIEPLDGSEWSLVLIPGWRDLIAAPVEEICARQYIACNEAVLDARSSIDPSRWIDAAYEDLVRSPVDEFRRIYAALGLDFDPAAQSFAAALAEHPTRTTLTAPRPGKWREQNPEAIARVLPQLLETERRLGYDAV